MDSVLYYSFSALIIITLSTIAYRFTDKDKKTLLFPVILIAWQLVVGSIGSTGFYENFTLPPNLVYTGIIPTFIILGLFFLSNTSKQLSLSIPKHIPILFQSFRIIVELLIFKVFLSGLVPIESTFQGYNYEFYFGFSALFIGYLSWRKFLNNKIILAWNVLGLFMLAFIVGIFITSGLAYKEFWGRETKMIQDAFLHMPYLSIATFYMPIAVWIHIFSIKQHK
jgi:hypothetical protein